MRPLHQNQAPLEVLSQNTPAATPASTPAASGGGAAAPASNLFGGTSLFNKPATPAAASPLGVPPAGASADTNVPKTQPFR